MDTITLLASVGVCVMCYVYIRVDMYIARKKHEKKCRIIFDRYWHVQEQNKVLMQQYFENEGKFKL